MWHHCNKLLCCQIFPVGPHLGSGHPLGRSTERGGEGGMRRGHVIMMPNVSFKELYVSPYIPHTLYLTQEIKSVIFSVTSSYIW